MTPTPLVLTRARLWGVPEDQGAPTLHDVHIAEGVITAVVPTGSLAVEPLARVVDVDGGWVMPGLVDHHVHFTLWSKHRGRASVVGATSARDAAQKLSPALAALAASGAAPDVPLVGRGFQDALWPDVPTAQLLDDAAAAAGQPSRPIVLLSHDLHSVWINSTAAVRYGAPAGLLREAAAFDLEIAVERDEAGDPARVEVLVREAVRAASARGVTGIMDLEMADNPAVWAARVASGLTALRVVAGVYPQHLEAALARGERTGVVVDGTDGLVTVGPLKVFADGALNTRTAWCFDAYPHTDNFGHAAHAPGELARVLAGARSHGFEVALHAIGDRAVAEALDAFEASGARGSVEHAQLMRAQDVARCARSGVAAGIHPEHALDDRDVSDVLWVDRTARAFPYGALAAAGVELRMGSDAPVSPLDPWMGISAAVHRTKDERPAWEPANGLSIGQALAASWSAPAIRVGGAADLVAVEADPGALGAGALREMQVALTVTVGRVTHEAL